MPEDTIESRSRYFDPKVLAKISRLDVRARMIVEGFISGMHRSPYHGYSVEFAEYREYVPGDDIKHIDWKVWARNDRFFLKQYEEETNLRCTILLDCSHSMAYGEASGWSKFDHGATLAASLSVLLQRQQDAAGLVLFDNDARLNMPPKTHPNHIKQMLHELGQASPANVSDVDGVFSLLPEQIGKRGLVVLISDLFLDLDVLQKMLQQFGHRRHDVVIFHLLHEHELTFPFDDNTKFEGLEDDFDMLIDAPSLRQAYLAALEEYRLQVSRICTRAGHDYVPLSTAEYLDASLSTYLAKRRTLIRRG